MKPVSIVLAGFLLAAGSSFASGIDCGKASSAAEKLICADAGVARLDTELAGLFAVHLQNTHPNDRQREIAAQKQWIAAVRNLCTEAACLRAAYLDRLQALSRIDDETAFIYEPREADETMALIRAALKRFGVSGEVSACEPLIRVGSGPEHSVGARCSVDHRALHVCDDSMVGKLTVSFQPSGSSADALAAFTKQNCPPGG